MGLDGFQQKSKVGSENSWLWRRHCLNFFSRSAVKERKTRKTSKMRFWRIQICTRLPRQHLVSHHSMHILTQPLDRDNLTQTTRHLAHLAPTTVAYFDECHRSSSIFIEQQTPPKPLAIRYLSLLGGCLTESYPIDLGLPPTHLLHSRPAPPLSIPTRHHLISLLQGRSKTFLQSFDRREVGIYWSSMEYYHSPIRAFLPMLAAARLAHGVRLSFCFLGGASGFGFGHSDGIYGLLELFAWLWDTTGNK